MAWSPTTFTSGVPARRQLCRLARPVAQPRPQMQQRGRRAAGEARVAIRGASADAFKEAQHRPTFRHTVNGLHQVHLGGARVGEADAEIVRREGANQALRAVHVGSLGKGRQLITRGLCAPVAPERGAE